jgi:uroporphyrinogen decarboxylase
MPNSVSMSVSINPPLKNDLLLRAARLQPVERVPVWLMRQAGRSDPAYRSLREQINLPLERLFRTVPSPFSETEVEWAIEISLLPKRIGVDAIIVYQDILTPLAPMGVHFRFAPGPVLESPIRTKAQIAGLVPLDDPISQCAFNGEVIGGLRRALAGELPLIGFAGAPMTLALFMIAGRSPMVKGGGISDEAKVAFQMMHEEPALMHTLLERLTQMTIGYLNYQISQGAQVVQLFESVADQINRRLYETFVQPYHEQIFEALNPDAPSILFARECPYLDLMLKSGADVLSVGKCVELAAARAEAKGTVAFQGNMDNEILRDGSFDDITAAVNGCLEAGGKIGYILNLSHGIFPDTPFENVKHFVKAAKAYSWDV